MADSTDLQVNDNPYDPNTSDFQTTTPPMDEVIRTAMRNLSLNLNVWRPAKITNVKGSGRVDIEIQLQAKYIKGDAPFTIPTIQDCLVGFMQGADYSIKPPIAVGDVGIALFCDRSLDSWSVQGGLVYPNDARTHHLSDCVFIPGISPFNAQVKGKPTDLVMTNGDSQVTLQKDGKILIKNKSQELIDLVSQLVDALATQTFTLTMLGPQPFIASTITLLNQIKANLATLKGP